MKTLSHDDAHGDARAGGSRSPRRLKGFIAGLAIGQILRDEYVYEIHGPFIAAEPKPRRLQLAAWMIAKITG